MIVRKEIDLTQPLTPSQVEMLHNLESKPISPDEDCPELTMDQLAQFRRISAENREERCKQTVTLRLSPQTLRRAKSLGKGYTSVLSRILESALENPDIVRHYLYNKGTSALQRCLCFRVRPFICSISPVFHGPTGPPETHQDAQAYTIPHHCTQRIQSAMCLHRADLGATHPYPGHNEYPSHPRSGDHAPARSRSASLFETWFSLQSIIIMPPA